MPSPEPTLCKEIISFLDSKKATDIISIDLRKKSSIADFLVIATGTSQKHIYALATYLQEFIKKKKISPNRIEGTSSSDWIVIDVGDVLVHLFTEKGRQYYELEKIWSDGVHQSLLKPESTSLQKD